MKLTVQLLTWNGGKYIPYLFNSLKNQTFKNWKLNILDNNSSDNTVDLIKNELNNFDIGYKLDINKENVGFARGHNQLFKKIDTEYFLLLNQDLFLEKDCFEKLVNFLDINKQAAAVSPRLMRWNFPNTDSAELVDSLGLRVFKNRRVVDLYNGKKYSDISENIKKKREVEVFGVSGALPMFRCNVIKDLVFEDGGFFDKNYGSYKEDVDLAYRINSCGYKSFVLLDSVAYHDRSSENSSSVIKNKKGQSDYIRYNSYKNHLMTLYKNEYWQNFILDSPWILWYELRKFLWFLFFDRGVLKGLGEIWNLRKDLRNKRKIIKNKRKVDWIKMRKWV